MDETIISQQSQWQKDEITEFLEQSVIPMRLSSIDSDGAPMICSLWFYYDNGELLAASHKSAYLVSVLKNNSHAAFEIATNDYPYCGVRGKAKVSLTMDGAGTVLGKLIDKYLQGSNEDLSNWLMSRVDDEYVIRLELTKINAWDFSNRMKK